MRTETPRLVSSRTIPTIDDLPVWSIGCFRILPGYRRRGVARALLHGVVDAAREAGAPGVEAYPIDPDRIVMAGELVETTGRIQELQEALDLPASTCSYHLRLLREAGVTRTRAQGTLREISLRRDDLEARFPGLVDVLTR